MWRRFRFVSLGGRGRGKEVLEEHRGIFEALEKREVKLAQERMELHIKNTQQSLMEAIKEKILSGQRF